MHKKKYILKTKIDLEYYGYEIKPIEVIRVDLSSGKISFAIDEIRNTKTIKSNECIINKKYIFGIDENGIPFTLYNCQVFPSSFSYIISKITILWEELLYGIHLSDIDNFMIDKLNITFDNNTSPMSALIGRESFSIEEKEILVETDWDIASKGGNKRINCILFSFTPHREKNLYDCINIFKMLIDIYFWKIGFFPDYYNYEIIKNDNKYYYFDSRATVQSSAVYNSSYIYDITDENINFEKAYEQWKNIYLRKKNLFHLFMEIQHKNFNQFEEVTTFNYIQCLESFYTSYFDDYYIFPNEYKNKIINEIKYSFSKRSKNNKRIRKIIKDINRNCNSNYSYELFYSAIDGKFNSINEISLSKLISKIFNISYSKTIFKYEYDNRLITKFKKKTYNHRNYIAHMKEKDSEIFKEKENEIAQKKFKLLFRCLLLEKLDIKIDDNKLEKVVDEIDKLYETI